MGFATINTRGINTDGAAESFRTAAIRGPFESAVKSHIMSFGGDGDLALELARDWRTSPYLSALRWAVTGVTGGDVARELEKVQKRSAIMFREYLNDLGRRHAEFVAKHRRLVGLRTYKTDLIALFSAIVREGGEGRIGYDGDAGDEAKDFSESVKKLRREQASDLVAMARIAEIAQGTIFLRTVAAMSALSQAVAMNGPLLHRGICCQQGRDIAALAQIEDVVIGTDHATSFTSSLNTAKSFAGGIGAPNRSEMEHGAIVISFVVPRKSIVASPMVFDILTGESEWIVATDGEILVKRNNIEIIPTE